MVAYRRLAFAGVVMGLGAMGGLFWLVNRYPPTGVALVAFFLLVFLVAAGLAWAATSFLNRRFAGAGHVGDALRQGVWVGLLTAFCLWLKMVGVFSWALAIMLAAVFALVELFIRRTREGQ